jgi:CheY-like chemotaxis protein
MSLILYVEDDAVLQVDGESVLLAAGYDVLLANDGTEGCEILRERGAELCALITDIHLAGDIDGWQVASLGREINQALPVLYVTASERRSFAERGVPQSELVAKPFEWPHILRTVSMLLAN